MQNKAELLNFSSIFYQMLRADFTVFKSAVKDKIINSLIYSSSFIIISAYILPKFGVEASYGVLMASGLVASVGTFEMFMAVVNLVSDINGDKIINFYLTLPIPSWLIFVRMVFYSALSCTILSIATLVASKVLLWNQFDLTGINWFKLSVIILFNTIF